MKFRYALPLTLIGLLLVGAACFKKTTTTDQSSNSTVNTDTTTNTYVIPVNTNTDPNAVTNTSTNTNAVTNTSANVSIDNPPPILVNTNTTATTPSPRSFTVNASDTGADLTTISVAKGTSVTITFKADPNTTYYGGLDFRSSVVNTGTVASGGSKTVTFTANTSFSFQPYWPSTNTAKPYTIDINVQ